MHSKARPGDAAFDRSSSELCVQAKWSAARIFECDRATGRPKWFIVELPLSANGKLHLGHLRNCALGDSIARFRRMAGFDVLYTTGFDAFGLPSENAAREQGLRPAQLVEQNIAEMLRQFARLGLSYDQRRILSDHEPRYYRWFQWVFLKLLAAGHIYRRKGAVHWCPSCRSTLAESLVEAGHRPRRSVVRTRIRAPDRFG
jgi:leucyl-tRNA synthetase